MNNAKRYDTAHVRHLAAYQRQIDAIYREAAKEAAKIGTTITTLQDNVLFSFDNYPKTKKRIDALLKEMQAELYTGLVSGIRSEWTLANNKNNELSRAVFGDNIGHLTPWQERRYFSNSVAAADTFAQRKVNGLDLSERVWNITDQFKGEIELGLDLGIRDGKSAASMTRDLRNYLQHPDVLFRRVRDQHGILRLSQAAKDYHPGQGVYRSSYKNARRLTATETNIAYHTADHDRWQKMDFVVGIEIKLSGNHTCLGKDGKPHPFYDICDELQGRYPKDFKFTGWHPHCRCFAIPILKTWEEMAADDERILNGEEPTTESVNTVREMPDKFKQWTQANQERIDKAKQLPYFIKDNGRYFNIATQEKIRTITDIEQPVAHTPLFHARRTEDEIRLNDMMQQMNTDSYELTIRERYEIAKNNIELEKMFGFPKGTPMTINEADHGKSNPNYTQPNAIEKGYEHNCQTCTVSYELRRRGFDVEAKPNPILDGYKRTRAVDRFYKDNHLNWGDRFVKPDGSAVDYLWASNKDITSNDLTLNERKIDFINRNTVEPGRYEIYCQWSGGRGAHVFNVERTKDGNIIWFDPQTGLKGGIINKYIDRMIYRRIGVLRIDNKLINPKITERLIKAHKDF